MTCAETRKGTEQERSVAARDMYRRGNRQGRALPVLLVGIGMCALVAVVSLVTIGRLRGNAPAGVSLLSAQSKAPASEVGFGMLGSVGDAQSNVVNALGSLGSLGFAKSSARAPASPGRTQAGATSSFAAKMKRAAAMRVRSVVGAKRGKSVAKAKQMEVRADALEAESKKLRAEAMEEMAAGSADKKAAPVGLPTAAREITSMVMSAIRPELRREQAEIAKLANVAETEKAAKRTPVTYKWSGENLPAAFPDRWSDVELPAEHEEQTQMKSQPWHKTFQAELSSFMSKAGPFTHPASKVKTLPKRRMKAATDYKIHVDERYTDPGAGAYGDGMNAEWRPATHGTSYWADSHSRGSPCNLAGSCNHYVEGQDKFVLQDPEHWRKHFLKRYKKPCEDGNGNLKEGEEPCAANDVDALQDDGEEIHLGDEEVMRGLDDYVPPNDAYIHNLLTSGTYGIDHFGHLAPQSKENYDLMYGEDSKANLEHSFGHELHSPGRGGLDHIDRAARHDTVNLGDDQIGNDDKEVPTMLTHPFFPGPDHDHFDHWHWKSPLNQELLNGKYWKRLRKDGMMDRNLPASEAYQQQIGGGHDRHPLPDFALGTWNQGFGYGVTKEEPQPFERARKETHGAGWRSRVFTGTHEDIEMEKGVVRNMVHTRSYFKEPGGRPSLREGQERVA